MRYLDKSTIVLVEDGEGGIDELMEGEYFVDTEVMYALLRSDDGTMRCQMSYVGPRCKVMMRARINIDKNSMPGIFGQTHFSLESADVEELCRKVKEIRATDMTGHKNNVFTGEKKRVGRVVQEWELELYRSCWKEVGLLGFPYDQDWVREWHDTGHLNWTVFNEKNEVDAEHVKMLKKVRRRINRVPEDVIPKKYRRVIRRACNFHRDGDMALQPDELDMLVRAIGMFDLMANMATEPEDIDLAVHEPMLVLLGETVNIGPATVTPEDALKGLEYRAEPALPAGLIINAEDGSISGTAEEACPETTYMICAQNKAGEVSAPFVLTVQDGVKPTGLVLNLEGNPSLDENGCLTCFVGEPVTVAAGTVDPPEACDKNFRWRVEPALPDGLSLMEDGTITGTPTVESPEATYTIIAQNNAGQSVAPIRIAVQDGVEPESIVLAQQDPVYLLVGDEVNIGAATVSPQDALKRATFVVNPALPDGLTLGEDGSITGTAAAPSKLQSFTISIKNKQGEASTGLVIEVLEAVKPTSIALATDFLDLKVLDEGDAPLEGPTMAGPTVGPEADDHGRPLKGITFKISGDLPDGLIFNPEDGSISGAPTTPLEEETTFTITAENAAGEVSSDVKIRCRLKDLSSAHARTYEERNANYADSNIFCKIARGEIPCRKVYEDDLIIAFLDIAPAAKGHTVVTTKQLYQSLDVVPPHILAAIMAVLPKLAIKVCDAVGAKDYNILSNNGSVAGQTIFNTHIHIIPRTEGDALNLSWGGAQVEVDPEEMDKLALAVFNEMQ